jgi:hypothetical protein
MKPPRPKNTPSTNKTGNMNVRLNFLPGLDTDTFYPVSQFLSEVALADLSLGDIWTKIKEGLI